MARKRTWTADEFGDWQALLESPSFGALDQIASQGIERVSGSALDALIHAFPGLSGYSESSLRADIELVAARLSLTSRNRRAFLALVGAGDHYQRGSREDRVCLARAILGHGDKWAAHQGLDPSTLSAVELARFVTSSPSAFLRPPSEKRAPGERWHVLRAVHVALGSLTNARSPEDTEFQSQVAQRVGSDLDLRSLVSLLDQGHHAPLERFSMKVSLRDGDSEWFFFDCEREFHGRLESFVVGVAAGDECHQRLSLALPELRDLIWLPDETQDLVAEAVRLAQDGMLEVADPSSPTGFAAVPFQRVSETSALEQRVRALGIAPDRYVLFEYRPVATYRVHYRSFLSMRMRRARRRCTWYADSPTYVDRVSIDVSQFSDATQSADIDVSILMPGARVPSAPSTFTIVTNGWVLRRHGFTLRW